MLWLNTPNLVGRTSTKSPYSSIRLKRAIRPISPGALFTPNVGPDRYEEETNFPHRPTDVLFFFNRVDILEDLQQRRLTQECEAESLLAHPVSAAR